MVTAMVQEVEKAPEEHLLHVDEDQWAGALATRWSVEAPALHGEKAWMDPPKEVQVDVSWDNFTRAISDPSTPTYIAGYRVVAHVPFTGDKAVFRLQPSTHSLNPPRTQVLDDELREVIEYPHDRKPNIRAVTQELISSVEKHLAWARADIEQFNAGLQQQALSAIRARRERVVQNYRHLEETGLPVGPPEESSKTYIANALVRRPAPVLPSLPDSQPIALEPVLADEVFEHILSIIRSVGGDMERSPATYSSMGEEDLRQVLLAALNTHYHGQTMAEAFNVKGKTDLLTRYEGRNLFVGECKFWSGAKGFLDTVDQLFRYQAWRDTKLVIVLFVRERDLTAVVDKAREALAQHERFVEWREAASETELRATVSWPGDERRHADLNVFFVHTPKR
jgi:hypothetical protein